MIKLLQNILLFTGSILATWPAVAQRGENKLTIPPGEFFHNQQFTAVQYDNIIELREKREAASGSVYLNDEWLPGTLYTTSGHVLQDARLRYDIKNDVMEINTPDGVKTLQGRYIKQFELQEAKQKALYVSGNESVVAEEPHAGFYKVLVTGPDARLLSRTELHLQRANYKPQFDVGYKNDRLVKREKLFLAKGNELTKLEKDSYAIFGNKAEMMKTYAKTNKLKLHNKKDAEALVQYYNTL